MAMTPEERAEKILEAVEDHVEHYFGDVCNCLGFIAAEIRAAVEEALSIGHLGEVVDKRLARAEAEAYEDAAKHFRSQIRTYTGEQVARALLDLRDGKIIRAKAKEAAG